MDGSRFDAWTRRGFGLAAGGVAGTLLAQAGLVGTEAKKKKKKKKKQCPELPVCRGFGASCTTDGTRSCCCGLDCRPAGMSGNACCRAAGTACTTSGECCSTAPNACTGGFCFCKTNGQPCTSNGQCCSFRCGATGTGPTCLAA